MNNRYNTQFYIGSLSGCHQIPERSFYYKDKQFPICARCTGAFLGYFIGAVTYNFLHVPLWISVAFCIIMFVDWLLQKINIMQSTNIRRLITGTLCGFGIIQIFADVVNHFIKIFI
ncbi:MAG: DUF2085 domain-containing protein [Clostridia bacterium]|nr:DUF2085 domain-containing protein [Clostridia bacterium]